MQVRLTNHTRVIPAVRSLRAGARQDAFLERVAAAAGRRFPFSRWELAGLCWDARRITLRLKLPEHRLTPRCTWREALAVLWVLLFWRRAEVPAVKRLPEPPEWAKEYVAKHTPHESPCSKPAGRVTHCDACPATTPPGHLPWNWLVLPHGDEPITLCPRHAPCALYHEALGIRGWKLGLALTPKRYGTAVLMD